jgi:hydrogenase expression/formation protein HypD
VYSPLDALELARTHPTREVVFFGIGFETTAPANAMAVLQAKLQGLRNFSMLASHVLVPPAISAILSDPDNRVQAFLGPGHVCAVMGSEEYAQLVDTHAVPIVITGFEPVDLLEGILRSVRLLESRRPRLENQYARSVRAPGNVAARAVLARVFETSDRAWRGIGVIPRSGYRIRAEFREHDAELRFGVADIGTRESPVCISGRVLRGLNKPTDCPAFGRECTPLTPLGATMVSAEGACAAYHQYGRQLLPVQQLMAAGAERAS